MLPEWGVRRLCDHAPLHIGPSRWKLFPDHAATLLDGMFTSILSHHGSSPTLFLQRNDTEPTIFKWNFCIYKIRTYRECFREFFKTTFLANYLKKFMKTLYGETEKVYKHYSRKSLCECFSGSSIAPKVNLKKINRPSFIFIFCTSVRGALIILIISTLIFYYSRRFDFDVWDLLQGFNIYGFLVKNGFDKLNLNLNVLV